jgi:hypothetical protein
MDHAGSALLGDSYRSRRLLDLTPSELDGSSSDATRTRFGPSGEVTVAHHGVQLSHQSRCLVVPDH